jgi:uncharacterized membrane protein YkvA (DUF1232 family)
LRELRRELHALYLAGRDPRVPWYAKALAGFVVLYALSPIDLIPDWIPLVGLLDDLVIVPIGIVLARRMIPAPVLAECRARADAKLLAGPRRRIVWVVAAIAALWIAAAIAFIALLAYGLDALRP